MIKLKGTPDSRYSLILGANIITPRFKRGDMRRWVYNLASASSIAQHKEYWKGWDTDSQMSFYNIRNLTYTQSFDLGILTPVVK